MVGISLKKRRLTTIMLGGSTPYSSKVLSIAPANLIAYWPMWEAVGTLTADNYEGTAARDGTYGVGAALPTLGQPGIGDGRTCPSFDGGDVVNVYSVSLMNAFSGQEGTVAAWAKVSAAGVWTDAAFRRVFKLFSDAANYVTIYKTNVNNQITYGYNAAGTTETVNLVISTTAWFHVAIVWSLSGDYMRAYINGAQTGVDQTVLGTYANPLDINHCMIGATTLAPTQPWSGWLAHVAVWTTPLTTIQIASLATV